jgi:hypothetical protein
MHPKRNDADCLEFGSAMKIFLSRVGFMALSVLFIFGSCSRVVLPFITHDRKVERVGDEAEVTLRFNLREQEGEVAFNRMTTPAARFFMAICGNPTSRDSNDDRVFLCADQKTAAPIPEALEILDPPQRQDRTVPLVNALVEESTGIFTAKFKLKAVKPTGDSKAPLVLELCHLERVDVALSEAFCFKRVFDVNLVYQIRE